jgi:hypothetical protein
MSREVKLESQQMKAAGYSSRELSAFDLAALAEERYHQGLIENCWQITLNALRFDPWAPDGHRILALVLTTHSIVQMIDQATISEVLRESLFFLRRSVLATIASHPGRTSEEVRLRPFVRFVIVFAGISFMVERLDLTVYALEEVLRLDHEDHLFARESLVLCYLKLIGRKRRGEIVYAERTVEHLRALTNCHFENSLFPLFDRTNSTGRWYNEDLMILRWVDMFLKFHVNDNSWEEIAKAEHEICPWIFQYIFEELPKESAKKVSPKNDSVQRNATRISEGLMICLHDWPEFTVALHHLLRTQRDPAFELRLLKQAPRTREEASRDGKHHLAELTKQFLDKGRDALGNRRYDEALSMLTLARRSLTEAMKPGMVCHAVGPFQIISNRALAAERLGCWNLCRHDTRLTLFMKNDHMRSYERLPMIAEWFGAETLKQELEELVTSIKTTSPTTLGGWRTCAHKAISLISMTAIMASIAGRLTPELRQEMVAVGIDDMLTPVTSGPDWIAPLPWIGEGEFA